MLDGEWAAELDSVANLAARLLAVPIGLVVRVSGGSSRIEGRFGLAAGDRVEGLGTWLARLLDLTVARIGASTRIGRQGTAQLVVGSRPVRFAAGGLVAPAGGRDGFLVCALDHAPGEASPEQREALELLAEQVAAHASSFERVRTLGRELQAQRAAARASHDTERLLIDYLLTATDGVWQTDAEHRFVSTTTDLATIHIAQARVFGRTPWELAGSDPDREPLWAGLRADFEARRPFRGFEYSLRDDSGAMIWREVNGNPVFDEERRFHGFRGTSRDITDRKRAEEALREMNSRLSALAESGIVGIIIGERDRIGEANEEFLRIIGYDRATFSTSELRLSRLSVNHEQAPLVSTAEAFGRHGVWGPMEREFRRQDGSRAPVLVSSILLDRPTHRWMCLVQDISERKHAEARIRELADRDALTGLLNRRSFMERFDDTLGDRLATGACGALILLDLDHFKNVNDTLGHDAGDALLCEAAARLCRTVRQQDSVARLGGDEFAILVLGIDDLAEVERIAGRLLEDLREPFPYDGRLLRTTASVGITLFPDHGCESKQLLKNADIALYRSKARGRRSFSLFDPQMLEEFETRMALDSELQRAYEANEFCLAFQPIVGLEDGRHAGFEALLRWRHPDRGELSPDSFVTALEESGLIVPVGRVVMQTALAQLRSWLDAGCDPGHVAVNVAAHQLRQADFTHHVARQLALHRLEAKRLRVEITENVLLEDSTEISTTLEGLHRLGVAIALDDFGTGFASLSHLKKVPVDVLKIDRSFVRDIGTDADDAAISRTIIALAHSLGMRVVAEGIATEEALAFLRINGCDEGQGYLLDPPLTPAAALLRISGGHRSARAAEPAER
jgi:diguanylate cyclase (GGDEF)-like protein/PAS domain S-box-containing protein